MLIRHRQYLLTCPVLISFVLIVGCHTNQNGRGLYQQGGTVSLHGMIVDEAGDPLPNVQVSYSSESTGHHYKQETDSKGEYCFLGVESTPTYAVSVNASGYIAYKRANMRFSPFTSYKLDFFLSQGTDAYWFASPLPMVDQKVTGGQLIQNSSSGSNPPDAHTK